MDGEFKGEAGNTLMRRMGKNTNELGDQTFEFEQGLPDAEPGKKLYKTVDKPVDKQVANPNIEQEQVANDPTLNQESKISGAKIVGWTMVGIGAVLFVASLTTYIVKMYQYHNPTFTQIPNYIVDRSDIEEFDANGNRIGLNFKDFTYYRVVKCNRQELGVSSSAKKGVSDYEAMGCGSAADLNGDVGPQWMALYTVRDAAKGSPILADSLLLQTGSSDMPAKCDTALRFFNYDFAVNLGDDAYAYHNEKNGVYFFWDQDENAVLSQTASTFSGGALALVGVLALAVGSAITALFLSPRRKKEQTA